MYSTKEQALKQVNECIPNSISFENGLLINQLLILTDDKELNTTLLAKYKVREITSQEVAEHYGNGQNLLVYAVSPQFYSHPKI